jgi:uncharacterized membrane protein YeaQ/YmgE (transglycosylase-associated protein family)
MQLEPLLVLLAIGAIAGYLASQIVKGYGYGLLGNIGVGIVGAFLGGWLLPRLGLYPGGDIIGQIVSATLGAVVLLGVAGFFRRIV